ncbi:hypothetical protein, partial [Streptomyces sp. SID3343]|uniref:hypothetical protein n=1 Tax=Streptomyces sp. SID3343 TaxID=2690260 RepID=UPI001F1B1EF9
MRATVRPRLLRRHRSTPDPTLPARRQRRALRHGGGDRKRRRVDRVGPGRRLLGLRLVLRLLGQLLRLLAGLPHAHPLAQS